MDCYFNTPLGRRKIKVDIWLDEESKGTLYCLEFPYFKPMVEYVKTLDRPHTNSFDPKTKIWRIKNNRRNLFSLNLITKNDMVKKFVRPLSTDKYEGNWERQNIMQNAILGRKTCIIAGAMRTGKTKPTLNCINLYANETAWIISKKSALRGVKREVIKWGASKEIKYFTYPGFRTHIQKLEALQAAEMYSDLETPLLDGIYSCINKATIPNFVVFDEMHKLKTPETQVTKAANALSKWMHELYGWDNYYLVGLSGTPSPKNPGDWWSLVEVICPGFIKEPCRALFERRLGVFEERESGIGQTYPHFIEWNEKELEKLYRRLKPIVFVFLKSEMNLPPMQYEVVEIKPSKELLRTAKLITKNEFHVLSALNKLRQLSDGFLYEYEYDEVKNKESRSIEFIGTPKIDQLNLDLEEYAEASDFGCGRMIIYAAFKGSIDIITAQCLKQEWVVLQIDARGWEIFTPTIKGQPYSTIIGQKIDVDLCLNEIDRSTNKGLIDKLVIVANPEAGGEGNEFSASPVIIYYSNSNKGAARMQSEARAHSNNMNKQKGLLIKDYCLLPHDYKIRKTLMKKQDLQSITLGEIKSLIT